MITLFPMAIQRPRQPSRSHLWGRFGLLVLPWLWVALSATVADARRTFSIWTRRRSPLFATTGTSDAQSLPDTTDTTVRTSEIEPISSDDASPHPMRREVAQRTDTEKKKENYFVEIDAAVPEFPSQFSWPIGSSFDSWKTACLESGRPVPALGFRLNRDGDATFVGLSKDMMDGLGLILSSWRALEGVQERLISRFVPRKTRQALATVRQLLENLQTDHGFQIDLLQKYSQADFVAALLTYAKLQKTVAQECKDCSINSKNSTIVPMTTATTTRVVAKFGTTGSVATKIPPGDTDYGHQNLVEDLAHYCVYAAAIYGWTMDWAMKGIGPFLGRSYYHGKRKRGRSNRRSTGWRVVTNSPRANLEFASNQRTCNTQSKDESMGADLAYFLEQTNRESCDVLQAVWGSDTHRPAYILVRDADREELIMAIRGTWSWQDLLTDLCCAAEKYDLETLTTRRKQADSAECTTPRNSYRSPASSWLGLTSWFSPKAEHDFFAHSGMMEAAFTLRNETQDIIEAHFRDYPSDSLVLVGHSMGGSVAALLGTLFWYDQNRFPCLRSRTKRGPRLRVYQYGPPPSSSLLAEHKEFIYAVVMEGDPFRSMSLGHLADVSMSLDKLCGDEILRRKIYETCKRVGFSSSLLGKDGGGVKEDVFASICSNCSWLQNTLQHLPQERALAASNSSKWPVSTTAVKLHQAGRLFLLSANPTKNKKHRSWNLEELPSGYFGSFQVGPLMLDLTKHVPFLYENGLASLATLLSSSN